MAKGRCGSTLNEGVVYILCMSPRVSLQAGDRTFFELIAQTAFCNPFSEQRRELDRQLLGRSIDALADERPAELAESVSARLSKLGDCSSLDLRAFAGHDRELMQTVFLFEAYHQCCRALDKLIEEQLKMGPTSAPVPFGSDVLAQLRQRGFGAAESLRYFAIFYQLRRAFHFIVRGLVGGSASMRELRRHLWDNVFTADIRLYDRYLWNRMEDFSTLLLGETGTGKGAAAAAVGRSGFIPFNEKEGRFAESFVRSFVALNLSQFPETLLESELFGHRKGAFTGAIEAHPGLLARCSPYGAIFLDEIGEAGPPIQIKLLQVLQDRLFCPVGSHEPVRFRGRVIAATNRPLPELRGLGGFRDDFYYRLCSDVIEVPPLRQRLRESEDELRQLLDHVVARTLGQSARELVDHVERCLAAQLGKQYPWPGNVRELEQATRRVLLTGQYRGSASQARSPLDIELNSAIEHSFSADQLLARYCTLLYQRTGSFEAVARTTRLDRRTAKKYVQQRLNLADSGPAQPAA